MRSCALIFPHDIPPHHNDYNAIEQQHQEIIEWQVHLLNSVLANTYSFKRWQHTTKIILIKEPGNFRMNCL